MAGTLSCSSKRYTKDLETCDLLQEPIGKDVGANVIVLECLAIG